jgi:hypothetical protein
MWVLMIVTFAATNPPNSNCSPTTISEEYSSKPGTTMDVFSWSAVRPGPPRASQVACRRAGGVYYRRSARPRADRL